MKLSKSLLGSFGALALAASSGGCIFFIGDNNTGDVEFSYVLLTNADNNGDGLLDAATDCAEVGVDSVRLMIGNEQGAPDGILDDNEIVEEAIVSCNQLDANGDTNLSFDEFGFFSAEFSSGGRDLFAVEFLDFNRNAILWQTFNTSTNFARFSFDGGVNVLEDTTNVLVFAGDNSTNNIPDQSSEAELQAFFGF